jgi:hypothetical protein
VNAYDYGGLVLVIAEIGLHTLQILSLRAQQVPGQKWAYYLFVRQFGPRTDTKFMNSVELFNSAQCFFTLGLHATVLMWIAGFVIGRSRFGYSSSPVLFAGFGIGAMVLMMLFAAGLWLLMLGFMKRMRSE